MAHFVQIHWLTLLHIFQLVRDVVNCVSLLLFFLKKIITQLISAHYNFFHCAEVRCLNVAFTFPFDLTKK